MRPLNEIEQQLIDILKKIENILIEEKRAPNKVEVLGAIGDLGNDKGYEVATGILKADEWYHSQWLFDLTWFVEDGKQHLKSLPLVAELELLLPLNEHKTDFEKLLAANAENRLFICQAYTDDIDSRLNYFQEGINLFDKSSVDDSFLIVIFDYYTHKMTYRKLNKEHTA